MNRVLMDGWSRFIPSGGPILTGMASDLHTTDLICALALFIGARTVVEAGTHLGHTAVALGCALRDAGLGSHLWTADPDDPYPSGFVTQVIGPIGLGEVVTFYHGDFLDMLPSVPGEIDLAYLDASAPGQPSMRADHFEAVWPRLRSGGLVLVDDCAGPIGAVFRNKASLYLPQHRGLVVCQK